jgi:hypothetical protein
MNLFKLKLLRILNLQKGKKNWSNTRKINGKRSKATIKTNIKAGK